MVYVVSVDDRVEYDVNYKIFDDSTNSVTEVKEEGIIELIEAGISIENVEIESNKVKLLYYNKLPMELSLKADRAQYTLILQIDDLFKLAVSWGDTEYMGETEFRQMVKDNKVSNVKIREDGSYDIIGETKITRDFDFEDSIHKRYSEFIRKSKMLGEDMSFTYKIEGEQVKLIEYLGRSTKVVVPNFITAIDIVAFSMTAVESIKLNNGLQYIGSRAFSMCRITRMEIPESVKLIGEDAFAFNKRLFDTNGELRKDRVTLVGKGTKMLKQRCK